MYYFQSITKFFPYCDLRKTDLCQFQITKSDLWNTRATPAQRETKKNTAQHQTRLIRGSMGKLHEAVQIPF